MRAVHGGKLRAAGRLTREEDALFEGTREFRACFRAAGNRIAVCTADAAVAAPRGSGQRAQLAADVGAEQGRELEDLIVNAAEETVAGLPQAFRERLEGVPILVAPRPDEELVREGFDPRALGLFEGPTSAEHEGNEASDMPTRIVLFAANLLAESVDEEQLKAEVATTVLHEVGHYFGLEEDDMERLGLD